MSNKETLWQVAATFGTIIVIALMGLLIAVYTWTPQANPQAKPESVELTDEQRLERMKKYWDDFNAKQDKNQNTKK
jgi:hypothetical protein